MTPKDQGKHCAVCQKTVVDFTGKKPEEIDAVFDEAGGDLCGYFSLHQLDNKKQSKVFLNPLNLFNRNWKYFVLTVAGFFVFGKRVQAQMKTGGAPVRNDEPVTNQDTIKVQGTIFTPDNQPAGSATITFSSGGQMIGETRAMANGTYVYRIPPHKITNNSVNIIVRHKGYSDKTISGIRLANHNNHLNITFEKIVMVMGKKKK
jgi:hypothetical protein